jgi:hypothetical protein
VALTVTADPLPTKAQKDFDRWEMARAAQLQGELRINQWARA